MEETTFVGAEMHQCFHDFPPQRSRCETAVSILFNTVSTRLSVTTNHAAYAIEMNRITYRRITPGFPISRR